MEGGSALMGFLLALTSYYPCSGQEGIVASKFLKTTVIIENVSVRNPSEFTDPVMRNQECSQLCTRDYGCRKYMVTTDITTREKLCYRYPDGENCVASHSEVSNKESVCYRKLKQSNGTECVSPVGYYGQNCEYIIKDCSDGKNNNFKGTSLSYVKPDAKIFEVLCEFDYGMTTIQVRRSDSLEVNFTRPWNDYVNGFGNTHSEYWLGLQNIYDLTNNGINFKLDMNINHLCYIRYWSFKLLDTSVFKFDLYTPSSSFNCSMSGIMDLQGTNFLTYDRHASYGNPTCPSLQNDGGWWYNPSYCEINLNNPRNMLHLNNMPVFSVIMRLIP